VQGKWSHTLTDPRPFPRCIPVRFEQGVFRGITVGVEFLRLGSIIPLFCTTPSGMLYESYLAFWLLYGGVIAICDVTTAFSTPYRLVLLEVIDRSTQSVFPRSWSYSSVV
jgi:hypothetical protein